MPQKLGDTNIDIPAPTDPRACGGYTGFNSLDLEAIFRAKKLSARRYQIAVGYEKPALARLPDGEILASGFYNHKHEPEYTHLPSNQDRIKIPVLEDFHNRPPRSGRPRRSQHWGPCL